MALPKYNDLYAPFLTAIKDGRTYTVKEASQSVANSLQLSEEDLAEKLPSQRQTTFLNRLNWAKTYLKKAGLVSSPNRGICVITDAGKNLLASGVPITNEYLKANYQSFSAFVCGNIDDNENTSPSSEVPTNNSQTPEEQMHTIEAEANALLSDELLDEIMRQSPEFFEQLVVDLMKHMGYGDGFKTRYSGDDGIDGVIPEDTLGFSLIYIQAKRWNPDKTIGKPEIQQFVGAVRGQPKGEKGLFITTAKFSQGAKDYAKAQHIILIDGQYLTSLMIEYGLGVSVKNVYRINVIDTDYFSDSN